MSSDSESQDSDDGRRFRFATTRKDVNPLPLRKSKSPIVCRRPRSRSKNRSRSKDRSRSRSRGREGKDHKKRPLSKERSLKRPRDRSRDKRSEKDKKKLRTDDNDADNKSKHKSRSKHKKRSRERSKDRSRHGKKVKKHHEDNKSSEKPEKIKERKQSCEKQPENGTKKTEEISPKEAIGPVFPDYFDYKPEDNKPKEIKEIGPVVPNHIAKNIVIGPTLPANFKIDNDSDNFEISKSNSSEDEDDGFGPLPADHPALRGSQAQIQLEKRARRLQSEFAEKTEPQKNQREEWMLELPPAQAVALGLGPRKFKTREGPDMSDRSIWTDTPADRLRKQQEKEENRFVKSESTSKVSKNHQKKVDLEEVEEDQPESLLDMHLKTLKKKKKKLEKEAKRLGLSTRRPFDRDIDLQTNRLDEARKKSIFKKAAMLNDRFTPGKY